MECAIDEWKTGTLKKQNFEAKTYSGVYGNHLGDLGHWSAFSAQTARENPGSKDLAVELLMELLLKAR